MELQQEVERGAALLLRLAALVESERNLRDLPEDRAVEALVLLDAPAHPLEERAHEHGGRGLPVRERAVEQQHVAVQHLGGDRVDERVLRAELVEDGGARDAGRFRHLGHGHLVEAAGGEELPRRLEDGRAHVAPG